MCIARENWLQSIALMITYELDKNWNKNFEQKSHCYARSIYQYDLKHDRLVNTYLIVH